MQGDARHSHDREHDDGPLARSGCLAAALIAVGVLVAGCGGTSPSGGVASLGSHVHVHDELDGGQLSGELGRWRRILARQPGRGVLGVHALARRA